MPVFPRRWNNKKQLNPSNVSREMAETKTTEMKSEMSELKRKISIKENFLSQMLIIKSHKKLNCLSFVALFSLAFAFLFDSFFVRSFFLYELEEIKSKKNSNENWKDFSSLVFCANYEELKKWKWKNLNIFNTNLNI